MLGGVSRTRAAELAERATFPAPIDTIAAGRVWDRADVEAWIRLYRPSQRDDD